MRKEIWEIDITNNYLYKRIYTYFLYILDLYKSQAIL